MIDPGAIPTIPGDMTALAGHAATLTGVGTALPATGAQVNSTWQTLAGVYTAPEAPTLFAATRPVASVSASVGEDIGVVGAALATYAHEVAAVQQRPARALDRMAGAERARCRTGTRSERQCSGS